MKDITSPEPKKIWKLILSSFMIYEIVGFGMRLKKRIL
jgi:hypothetical protein